MMSVGPFQLVIVLLIVLILFGAGKLPKVAKDLGGAINEFKSSMKDNEKGEDSVEKSQTENKPADSPQA